MQKAVFLLSLVLLISFGAVGQQQEIESDSSLLQVLPEFPEGNESLYRFLGANLRYPKSAIKAGYAGKIIVSFIIDFKGNVSLDSLDNSQMSFNSKKPMTERQKKAVVRDTNREIARVILLMPKWKPGIVDDEPVNVIHRLPLIMSLD